MAHHNPHHHVGVPSDRGEQDDSGGRNLLIALVLNMGITIAQVIGGVVSGSLSLLADAAHNGSDAASLGISWGARKVSQREADRERTFGYNRAEVVGALINLTALFVIAVFLTIQAVHRFIDPSGIQGEIMLIVGLIAFVEDGISVWLLWAGQKESINIRSAFIHMVGDTLSTLGVIVGGLLIMGYGMVWIDPLITAAIAAYIFRYGWVEIRKAVRLLIDSAPRGFDFDRMLREVHALDGVVDMHHIHLWHLDEHRVALEAHVSVDESEIGTIEDIKHRVKRTLLEDFGVGHSTLEIEIAGRTEHDRSVIRTGE